MFCFLSINTEIFGFNYNFDYYYYFRGGSNNRRINNI